MSWLEHVRRMMRGLGGSEVLIAALLTSAACALLLAWSSPSAAASLHRVKTGLRLLWPYRHRTPLLSYVAVHDCLMDADEFQECGQNRVVGAPDGHGGVRCGYAIGAGQERYGKLIPPPFPASNDVWMRGLVFFPTEFRLPQAVRLQGETCNMGVHIWCMYSNLDNPLVMVDFNIPAGTDHIQLYVYSPPGTDRMGSREHSYVLNTDFHPAEGKRRGQWQFWELHLHLGRPGVADGFLRFYADGQFIGSLEGQTFLPRRAGREWWIRYVDIQSNIGGGECGKTLWPSTNQWLTDEITVCSGVRCREGHRLEKQMPEDGRIQSRGDHANGYPEPLGRPASRTGEQP